MTEQKSPDSIQENASLMQNPGSTFHILHSMRFDPVCGMAGKLAAHGEVFCSTHCLKKFEEEKGLTPVEPTAITQKKINWGSWIVRIALTSLAIVFVLGFFVSRLEAFSQTAIDYIKMVVPAFLLGLIAAGLIDVFVPREVISSFIGQGKKSDVVKAASLGFLSATCSHGCLALSMELHKKGASSPAVLAFLLASPWASLPVTILLLRLFGWKGAVIIALAFLVAIATGLLAQQILKRTDSATGTVLPTQLDGLSPCLVAESVPFLKKFYEAIISLGRMTVPWIILGIGLAAVVQSFLSDHIGPWLGRGVSGPPLSMALASMMEVCSEGSAPLAFGIYTATGSALGSVFAFLEAGVVTDFNEISLVWANLGRKWAFALVGLSLPQVLLLAYLLNGLF